ncbi:MAG: ornithine cyclodeaminase [Osedax symbiont Rs2]|nr:MAG: ornithine cyclodeaminase [Osedax symbiont Rs2]
MKIINATQVQQVLQYPQLIAALQSTYSKKFGMPARQVFALSEESTNSDGFAVLPAWNDEIISVKAFTHLPQNPAKGLDMIHAQVMMFDRSTGQPLALVDGTELTYWRTAAISALAVKLLAREDCKTLLIFGTGHLAPHTVKAISCVRNIEKVLVAGRSQEKITATIAEIKTLLVGVDCTAVTDLQASVAQADIISCVTAAAEPLFPGDWVSAGTHVDLVGNHSPDKRECDSQLVLKAKVFVDSKLNVMAEAGEILIPIAKGLTTEAVIRAELSQLCTGQAKGRENSADITLFKAVGTALADLGAAQLVLQLAD